jgi:hypothetical protein
MSKRNEAVFVELRLSKKAPEVIREIMNGILSHYPWLRHPGNEQDNLIDYYLPKVLGVITMRATWFCVLGI